MSMRKPIAILVFAFVVALSSVGHAQISTLWTFDRLAAKADCVVVAKYVRTNDTGSRTKHPELTPGFPVIELETALDVLAVMKPCRTDVMGRTIRVKHYTPEPSTARTMMNGGTTLEFTPGAAYLMFLRNVVGGIYEPLSGHAFPTDSVYRVRHPDGRP
jgi:hypothetical protein